MKYQIKAGTTSYSAYVFIQDSSVTTGAGLTGLAYNTSSLVAYYALKLGAATAITLATLAAATSAWSSGGFKEVDATNMPGVYRFDIPNLALASGTGVVIELKGAANMAQCVLEIELVAYDPQDSVRSGLTALPNVAAGVSGGLPTLDAALTVNANVVDSGTAQAGGAATMTLRSGASATDSLFNGSVISIFSGTGAGQSRTIIGYVGSTKVATVGRNWVTNPDNTSVYKIHGLAAPRVDDNLAVIVQTGTGTGQLDFTAGVVKSNLVSILGTVLTETAGLIAAGFKKFFNVATPVGTLNSVPADVITVGGQTAAPALAGVAIKGCVTKSGSTYYVQFWLVANGTRIAGASLSALACTIVDDDGTDLSFTGTPSAAASGCVSCNGTLTTPGTNKPFGVLVGATYATVDYSDIILASVPA